GNGGACRRGGVARSEQRHHPDSVGRMINLGPARGIQKVCRVPNLGGNHTGFPTNSKSNSLPSFLPPELPNGLFLRRTQPRPIGDRSRNCCAGRVLPLAKPARQGRSRRATSRVRVMVQAGFVSSFHALHAFPTGDGVKRILTRSCQDWNPDPRAETANPL